MARGEIGISLRALAALPHSSSNVFVAALIQEAGIVPRENFQRLKLEHWEQEEFQSLHRASDRMAARQYATWVVNRTFAPEEKEAKHNQSRLRLRAQRHLRDVVLFLNHMRELGYDLNTVPQDVYDEFVQSRGLVAKDLSRFVRWVGAPKLRHTQPRGKWPAAAAPSIDDAKRWEAIGVLLRNETFGSNVRLAGLLAIVFGVALTRVVALPRHAVVISDDAASITFGSDAVNLPDQLRDLLVLHLSAPRGRRDGDQWLFPGRNPGNHLGTVTVSQALKELDIRLASMQRAARLTLARDVPVPVLADMLGVSSSAASKWSSLAGRAWAEYPKLRLQSHV